jgi:hypothetical protein
LGNPKTAWAGGILAAAGNVLVSLWSYLYRDGDPVLLQWNALYYTVMVLVFTWINAPLGTFGIRLESPYRMTAGALVCTLVMGPLFLSLMEDGELRRFVADQLASLGNPGTSGEGESTADGLIAAMIRAGLRGGIFASCMVFWWVNRQIASGIARIIRRLPPGGTLLTFHVPVFFVWILSLSLGAVLLGTMRKIEGLEIGGWNILVLSAILFLVQGGAVAFYYLLKAPPFLRILVNVGLIILLFTPGLVAAALGLLVILGIAENWVPFRTPRESP